MMSVIPQFHRGIARNLFYYTNFSLFYGNKLNSQSIPICRATVDCKNVANYSVLAERGQVTCRGYLTENFWQKLQSRPTFWELTCSRSYAKGRDRKKDNKVKNVIVNEAQLAQVINVEDFYKQLTRVTDKMKEDFMKHLTLRTSLGVLDTLTVPFEGTDYMLQDLAQIGRKNPKMYVLNLSSFPQVIPEVLKAINSSGLGLNPQQDGTTLFIPIPKITKEHRETLSKNAKAVFVRTKDSLRDVQNKFLKGMKSKDGVSEDLLHSVKEQVVSITDQKIAEAEVLLKTKQEELMNG